MPRGAVDPVRLIPERRSAPKTSKSRLGLAPFLNKVKQGGKKVLAMTRLVTTPVRDATLARRALLGGLLALAGAAALPVPAFAGTDADAAQQHIQTLATQALNTLQRTDQTLDQREQSFRALLREGFDLDFIARFVLGKYWKSATPDEQAEYIALFGEYVLRTYSSRLGGYAGESFAVLGATPSGTKDVLVATTIRRAGGGPIAADWRVRNIDGRYRIIDVAVEGVSMAITQRDEFASVVGNHGMTGLLEMLRARTAKVTVADAG
jgi:phospholipid transport system substrate-binding protein